MVCARGASGLLNHHSAAVHASGELTGEEDVLDGREMSEQRCSAGQEAEPVPEASIVSIS